MKPKTSHEVFVMTAGLTATPLTSNKVTAPGRAVTYGNLRRPSGGGGHARSSNFRAST